MVDHEKTILENKVENNDNSFGFVCQRNVTLALLDLDQTFMFWP